MNYRCLFCFIRAFENILENAKTQEAQKEKITLEFLKYMSELKTDTAIPEYAKNIHAKIKELIQDNDPYLEAKKQSNRIVKNLYPELKQKVKNSKNPFETALRLSIAGNIIDYGASAKFDILKTIEHVLKADFRINDSELLRKKIEQADSILYLGDNAGEIVLDKLFLETIDHPNVHFAVRGMPILNDITMSDADEFDLHAVAKVISNGYDAPSTLIEKSSDEFRKIYRSADLIISKGQGNFEGLMHETDERIFFLFMVKCFVIANHIGVKPGDFVVLHNK